MIITDTAELKRLERARELQYLDFTPYKAAEVLEDVRKAQFADIAQRVTIHFVERWPLACIEIGPERAFIYLHQLLNHPQTPRQVIAMVCVHELLHVKIQPREIKGRMKAHPPEFWEKERELFPDVGRVWPWIVKNFDGSLRTRPRLERIDVLPGWRRRWHAPRFSIGSIRVPEGRLERML